MLIILETFHTQNIILIKHFACKKNKLIHYCKPPAYCYFICYAIQLLLHIVLKHKTPHDVVGCYIKISKGLNLPAADNNF